MRAHQTFRVLLNAPVLKKMTVGDGRGKEPSGKSFSFGVIEHGTLVPYLLKVSGPALLFWYALTPPSYPTQQTAGHFTTKFADCRKTCLSFSDQKPLSCLQMKG